jgi:hypothetical protein
MTATLTLFGTPYDVELRRNQYASGNLALEAFDCETGQPFCMISVNLPGWSNALPADAFYAKHWSENAGLVEQLVEQGILVPVADAPEVSSGFVSGIKAYRFNVK